MMSEPVLIRSTMRTWDLTLATVAAIALFFYGLIWLPQADTALKLAAEVIGIFAVIVCVVILRRRVAARQWITVEADQFTIFDRSTETTYQDHDVQSIAIQSRQNFVNGELTSITRTVLLWLAVPNGQMPQQIQLRNTLKLDAIDPLSELIQRLNQRVLQQARELLDARKLFEGEGWELGKQELTVASQPEPLRCRLDDISLTRVVDQKLCLWIKGQAEPFAKINIHSVNAWVLSELLNERLAEKPPEAAAVNDGDLGEILFERRPRWFTRLVIGSLILISLLLALAFIGCALTNPPAEQVGFLIAGTIATLVFLALCVALLNSFFERFRCHRAGLIKTNLFGTRRLYYTQVEEFTYQARRLFVHGAYAGTQVTMSFVPFAHLRLKQLRFGSRLYNLDTELDNLREFVAAVIGSRMYRDVIEGQTVKWTLALVFHGTSLHYTPAAFFGRKQTRIFPVRQLDRFRFNQGQFELFETGAVKPTISVNTDEKNFFPGFDCWRRLVTQPAHDDS